MISKLEIDVAVSILKKYYRSAVERKPVNEKAQAEVKKLMTVMTKLYKIAEKYKEIELDEITTDGYNIIHDEK